MERGLRSCTFTLNQALCPRGLTCVHYINSLPCPLASVWVQLVGCPVRRSKEKESEVRVFISLTPSSVSSGCLCPLTKRLLLFLQGSLQYFFPYRVKVLVTFLYPCSFRSREGNSFMVVNLGFWHYSVPNSETGFFVSKSSSNYPNLRVSSVFGLGSSMTWETVSQPTTRVL